MFESISSEILYKSGLSMRLTPVILPDLGTGPDIPIVVSYWFAAKGKRVWEGERLVEVLAGAATFDVPSPVTGLLAEIRSHEEDRVAAGEILGLVEGTDDIVPGSEGNYSRTSGDPQPRPPLT